VHIYKNTIVVKCPLMPQKAMPACPVPEHSSEEEDVQKKADKLLKIFIVL